MAKNKEFSPFKNESDCIQIGDDLTIENRVDRISIFGSIDLTLDKGGLKAARELKAILDMTLTEMEKVELPEKVDIVKPKIVDNPF
ncbi:MAG: hypothetical protein JZU65_08100 [Chlorobium sp.]|nr:hypothetical protein [Chlorobium sp.]